MRAAGLTIRKAPKPPGLQRLKRGSIAKAKQPPPRQAREEKQHVYVFNQRRGAVCRVRLRSQKREGGEVEGGEMGADPNFLFLSQLDTSCFLWLNKHNPSCTEVDDPNGSAWEGWVSPSLS